MNNMLQHHLRVSHRFLAVPRCIKKIKLTNFSNPSVGATEFKSQQQIEKFQHLNTQCRSLSGRSCGIVGMPNIGKSTLFNAITETQRAEVANYPFCTIEPNIGTVSVPDERLAKLAKLAKAKKVIGTQIDFIDIAGLIKGAHEGKGLGNKFLSNIRSVNQIVHVVRCFKDGSISHVENGVDPIRDIDIINSELIYADLESVTKIISNPKKKVQGGTLELLKNIEGALYQSIPINLYLRREGIKLDEGQRTYFKQLNLLTAKPMLYVCNVGEDEMVSGNEYTKMVVEYLENQEKTTKQTNSEEYHRDFVLNICAKFEADAANAFEPEERAEILKDKGLETTGLQRLILTSYEQLGLITFFTVGEKETKAWTIKNGSTAQRAAGQIHSDMEKGFIKADVVHCEDYIQCNGDESLMKRTQKHRPEGKDYLVKGNSHSFY